jgi:hypothetical protein
MEHDPLNQGMKVKLESQYERDSEPLSGVFNLDKLEPTQVAELMAALGHANEVAMNQTNEHHACQLVDAFIADLKRYAGQNAERAVQIFDALASHAASNENNWLRAVASDVAPILIQHYADDYAKRKQVIDRWVGLLSDNDSFARETAQQSIANATDADWVDEPTARYLDSKLPPD